MTARRRLRAAWGFLLFAVAIQSAAAGAAELTAAKSAERTFPSSATSDDDIIAFIDAEIQKGWTDAGIAASPKATDSEWCRRVYLDVFGRVPTVKELKQFLGDTSPNKKQRLLDRLLDGNDDEAVKEYARNFTTHWTNLLIGRPPARRNRRDPTNREGMQQYLRSSFLRNKPYDQMVYELVSAQGSTSPGQDDYNGATNFLINKLAENATEATSKTAKFFLGVQVQCTQCHNHPFNDWKQDQFWSMNAFFRQTRSRSERDGREIANATLYNQDFKGEGSTPEDAELYYELRNGTLAVAYPKFVDGTKISASGYVKECDRRAELARLITKSEYLGTAIVNRMWQHFLGYGFTKPVDDMGPHNAASHPALLEYLGKEFAAKGFDLKRLIRWIASSEAYGLSSKSTKANAKDDPSIGERPKFSHFYIRQMQAEELYESILVVTAASKVSYEESEARKGNLLSQFTLTFGNDEGEETTTFNGSIPQMLMLMNGELVRSAIDTDKGSFLRKLVGSSKSESDVIEYLFLASLSRKPAGNEATFSRNLVNSRGGKFMSGYQDVLWALLNSNEFIFIH